MSGTTISVTADSRRMPPKITAPTTSASTTPMTRPDPSPSRPNWLRTEAEMELAWTALKTKP